MGMPMSVLKEDPIFDKIISIKYDVPNDRLDMFDDYKKQIDPFYEIRRGAQRIEEGHKMAIEYLGLSAINGPLVVLEGVRAPPSTRSWK